MKANIPVISGGLPIRKNFINFAVPDINKEDIESVVKVLKSGWLTTGPKVQEFEQLLERYIGSKHAIALSSCTAALHLSLIANKIGPGDEIITSPLTFASGINVIIHTGAKPVFVDVEKETGNIDPKLIEKSITKKTRAIIVTHLYGRPVKLDEILKLCQKYNLILIEDAAHALGAKYKGKFIGNVGDFTAFSFYTTKNITTGEGGALCTNKEYAARVINIYKLHGLNRDAWRRHITKNIKYYEVQAAGYKYNMTDLAAAIGISQLKRFSKNQKIRRKIWQRYNNEFTKLPVELPPAEEKGTKHALHLYTLNLGLEKLKVSRDVIRKALVQENIGTSIHFISLHLQPFYRKLLKVKPKDFPNALYISERTLALPLYPKLNNKDVEDVIIATKKVLKYFLK